jgi:hypothetical protein
MSEIDRLNGDSDWIDLEFVERERTPEEIVEMGIQLHLAGLSLSNTKQYLERLVSNAVEPPFTTGCKRLIYSRRERDHRITLRWTKP